MPAYAKSGPRIKAALIDSLVLYAIVAGSALIIAACGLSAETYRTCWLIALAAAVLYEPLTVSLMGASLGHYRSNIYVVDSKSNKRIGIVKSCWRFLLKSTLGWLSCIAIATSGKRLALHDMLSNSSVQIRNIHIAHSTQCSMEEAAHYTTQDVSPLRKGTVIFFYIILGNFLVGVFSLLAQSIACNISTQCVTVANNVATVILLGYIIFCAYIIFLGAKNRLFGCRPNKLWPGGVN